MVTIAIKEGNPEGYQSLCRTCTRGHIISGFRATEEEVFCRTFYIEREIRFPVRACTFYEDKRLATKEDMVEIAWHLRSTTSKPNRDMGFAGGSEAEEMESKIAQVTPATEPDAAGE